MSQAIKELCSCQLPLEEAHIEGMCDHCEHHDRVCTIPLPLPRSLKALRRFAETCEDDGSYDIDDAMVHHLAYQGLIRRHGTTTVYEITPIGQAVLASKEARAAIAITHEA